MFNIFYKNRKTGAIFASHAASPFEVTRQYIDDVNGHFPETECYAVSTDGQTTLR